MGVACGAPMAAREWAAGSGTDAPLVNGQVAVAFHAEVQASPNVSVESSFEDSETASWQSGNLSFTQWRDLPIGLMMQLEQGLIIGMTMKRFDFKDGDLHWSVDYASMTCKEINSCKDSPVRPLRRLASCMTDKWQVTHPSPQKPHPLRISRISKKDDATGLLNNDFFWQCFREVLQRGGYQVDITSADRMFDFANNQDFQNWKPVKKKLSRGGVDYEVPVGWKRFAVRVSGRFDDGDNTWMSLDGRDGEWAVAYHGTNSDALAPIVSTGLKAGSRQAFQAEVGKGIYCTPLLSTAKEYATRVQHQGRGLRFIIQCRVRPKAIKKCSRSDYWVINRSEDVRPYGVLVQQC